MNRKLGFILPRIFGLAIIAGIASLLLIMVAKLLVGVAIIGTVVMMIKKGMRHQGRPEMYGASGYGAMLARGGTSNSYQPLAMNVQQRSSGIIPIN